MPTIATWNVNSVNARLPNVLDWLRTAAPDVVLLQEIKCVDAAFPREAIEEVGYNVLTHGQKSYNGVAILAKGRIEDPVVGLPGDPTDEQARYLEGTVGDVRVASIYLPNGNPIGTEKFTYKLAWMERLRAHAAGLLAAGVPVVLAGDYNVTPEPRDVYPTRFYDDNALTQPEPRAAWARLVAQGWTDALRWQFPDEVVYTFWDYRRNRWERNGGMRLDHLLVSPDLRPRLAAAGVDREVRGRENASDHAPVWVELAEA
jgi:exodeoxyribonuclease-3